MKLFRVAMLVALSAAYTSCKDELGPLKQMWTAVEDQYELTSKQLHGEMTSHKRRLEAVAHPPEQRQELEEKLKAADASLANFDARVARAKQQIQAALAGRDVAAAKTLIDVERAEVEALRRVVVAEVDNAGRTTRIAQIRRETEIRELQEEDARISGMLSLASEGGTVEFEDIHFKDVHSEQLDSTPGTEMALARFSRFANACGELRLEVVGHSVPLGDVQKEKRLSEARAGVVKKALVLRGVAAAKIVKTSGVGASVPVGHVPYYGDAGSDSLTPEQRESARTRNERTEVRIVVKCKG